MTELAAADHKGQLAHLGMLDDDYKPQQQELLQSQQQQQQQQHQQQARRNSYRPSLRALLTHARATTWSRSCSFSPAAHRASIWRLDQGERVVWSNRRKREEAYLVYSVMPTQ
jgi:hypothetical protein